MSIYGSNEFYNEIKSIFVAIRFAYSRKVGNKKNRANLIYYQNALSSFYHELKLHSKENHNHVLVYCIDTLFEIMGEGNCTKINAFADVIHNMPEICQHVRQIDSFSDNILSFQNQYGRNYFRFL